MYAATIKIDRDFQIAEIDPREQRPRRLELAWRVAGYVLNMAHQDYRSIFLLSSAQAWLGLVAIFFLYRAFMAHGGDKHYVAPQHEPALASPTAQNDPLSC